MTNKKQKIMKSPRLLRGLVFIIMTISALILSLAWFIINYQIEQLVAQRTSEYAHSIAKIAANSSADALLSDDKLQLQMLVDNVAMDPYILSATIFAEDGQLVVKSPIEVNPVIATQSDELVDSENTSLLKNSTTQNDTPAITNDTQAFIQATNNIPFIEKISYQQVTAGWFKVQLNRQRLESGFRQALQESMNLILIMALGCWFVLFLFSLGYSKRVNQFADLCHRLLTHNAPHPPNNMHQWFTSLTDLADYKSLQVTSEKRTHPQQINWSTSQMLEDTLFCYCQFSLTSLQDNNTARKLSHAQNILQTCVKAHGFYLQGDLLSSALIPIRSLETINPSSAVQEPNETLTEAMGLIYTLKTLLSDFELSINMRAFVAQGNILAVSNLQNTICGLSLANRVQETLAQVAPLTQSDDLLCFAIDFDILGSLGQFEEISPPENTGLEACYRLKNLNIDIEQQMNRQINFIKQEVSIQTDNNS